MPQTKTKDQTLDQLFHIAVEKAASDLHIVIGKPPMLRIDGELSELDQFPPLTNQPTQEMLFTITSDLQKEKLLTERELDMSYEIPKLGRFRVNMHWEKGNIGMVARVVTSHIPTMQEILMPESAYKLARLQDGLILVTGPTGCGKSTTLAAMINLINHERNTNIITLEDPIEFMFIAENQTIIKQRELGSDMKTFAAGLKHTLRQDPDVIMVGEMRDLETIAATMTLAETGHLVLATLHTINAAQTVDRIIDVFPPYQQDQIRVQLSMSLRGVVSQKLLNKQGGGRMAAREVMINNSAISNLIRENKIAQIKTVIQTSAEIGMVTMDQDIKRLYNAGTVSKEIATSNMIDPRTLTGQ